MALVIAEAALKAGDLRQQAALDAVAAGWVAWMDEAADVGVQTQSVLSAAGRYPR